MIQLVLRKWKKNKIKQKLIVKHMKRKNWKIKKKLKVSFMKKTKN
jgi:hypothetical protein